MILTGQVTDVLTGDAVDGVPVRVGDSADTTRFGGRFRVEGAPGELLVVDGGGSGFSLYTAAVRPAAGDLDLTVPLVPLGPLDSGYYRNLLHLLRMMTGTGEPSRRAEDDVSISYESSPRTTILRRWARVPIRVHVSPYRANGFSWDEVIRRAMDRWEERTGLELFEETAAPADADVHVQYGGSYSRVIFERATQEGLPLAASLWISPDLEDRDQVRALAEHELGHVLMLLVHSEDPGHIMYWGGAEGRRISNDEALVVRCLYRFPNLTDMSAYVEKAPLSRKLREQKRVLAVVLIQAMVALFVILSAH